MQVSELDPPEARDHNVNLILSFSVVFSSFSSDIERPHPAA